MYDNRNIEQTKNIEQNNDFFEPEKKHKKYISFNLRVTLTSICLCVFLFCSIFLILTSIDIIKLENINYKETSNIDYKVYLKENEFFTTEYLDKTTTSYVASLIKNIKVNFNYTFTVDKENNFNIDYKVIGELIITNQKDGSELLKKEYLLLDKVEEKITDANVYTIYKDVVIDYDYYNNLANKFKYSYGIDTDSKLLIKLTVNEKNDEVSNYSISNSNVMSLSIPLSEKAINIKLDYKDLNEQKRILAKEKSKISDRNKFIIGLVLLFISLLALGYLLRLLSLLFTRKSKYDKYIKKLLREYDRLIINTKTSPKLEDYNVIKLDNFQELLDARDNVKGAIKYNVITEHQKCCFYFTHDKDLYLLIIKAVDME